MSQQASGMLSQGMLTRLTTARLLLLSSLSRKCHILSAHHTCMAAPRVDSISLVDTFQAEALSPPLMQPWTQWHRRSHRLPTAHTLGSYHKATAQNGYLHAACGYRLLDILGYAISADVVSWLKAVVKSQGNYGLGRR